MSLSRVYHGPILLGPIPSDRLLHVVPEWAGNTTLGLTYTGISRAGVEQTLLFNS